ncbi:MAG: murein hydrolase activator EnvC family protein [Oscillospiraceae bacterium]
MSTYKKLIRCLSFFLLFVVLYMATGPLLPVQASSVTGTSTSTEELQERLAELQKKQEETRAKIDALNQDIQAGKNTAAAAQARRAALQQEQALIEEQISLKKQEIETKVVEIDQKVLEITQKQQEFDTNDKLFRQRLVAIYKMNDAGILSTLLSVNSFSEFLSISKNLQTISKNDTDLLTLLEDQRAQLEQAKADLESLLATLQAEQQTLDAKWTEYNANIAQQNVVISAAMQEIAQSEADKAAALQEVEATQNEMEEIWKSLGGSSGAYVGGALEWPVPSHNGKQYISSWFGWRTLYGRPNFHTGVDIATQGGTPIHGADIVAANTGTVVMVVINNGKSGYGSYVILDHGGGVKTLYAHCSAIYVSVGQTVSRGATIAAVGNTGNSTGPHLHFELRLDNTVKTDPWPYLTGDKEL